MAKHEENEEKAYEKARDLTEKALEAYVRNDDRQGDKLVKTAKKVDPLAVEDVEREIEDDAASEHDEEKLKQELSSFPE